MKKIADLGLLDTAVQIYQCGLERTDLGKEAYWQALQELSFLHKKRDDFVSACQLWEQAAQAGQLYAYIELAKVCEHRHKDFSAARYWTQTAIEIVTAPDYSAYERLQTLPELEHRLARLNSKQEWSSNTE